MLPSETDRINREAIGLWHFILPKAIINCQTDLKTAKLVGGFGGYLGSIGII
jgi:hypothetical protein